MATASLVLGILSLMCTIAPPGVQLLGIILAIIGIVLSNKNTDPVRISLAKGGKVCSIIGLVFCFIVTLMWLAGAVLLGAFVSTGILEELGELIQTVIENITLS